MSVYKLPYQTDFYQGKVRDVYTVKNKWLVMVATDRISAFDVILPRLIPYKGQVLNQIAAYMLKATEDICPNWLLTVPAANVSIGNKCDPFRVEMVVRGNLTGHAWRVYQTGDKELCGVALPKGMNENDFFPSPIITPTTKAAEGHDEDISKKDVVNKGLVSAKDYQELENYSLQLFERGKQMALKKELILADTKYEFGRIGNDIYLIDEVHTPDSSRYFYADGFEERQKKNEKQKQLSKEFVREWLLENNFMGKSGQQVPEMSDNWIRSIGERYIELFQKLTGNKFKPEAFTNEEVEHRIVNDLNHLQIVP